MNTIGARAGRWCVGECSPPVSEISNFFGQKAHDSGNST